MVETANKILEDKGCNMSDIRYVVLCLVPFIINYNIH